MSISAITSTNGGAGAAAMTALSPLSPAERAAIAGATGYNLTASGSVVSPDGSPPWPYIVAFANSLRADGRLDTFA